MATFYVPSVNLIGKGVVNEVGPYIKELGYKKALLVTDKFIEGSDILPKVLKPLDAEGIEYVIFSDVEPNPTCKNVTDGVVALKEHGCDFIISLGGGSPQDAASCISIIATNGGKPQDYEGLHKSAKKGLPVVAINTTAGTSAEITINYVITDEERKVKMVMVDKNSLALISVNDPELMLSKPKGLTAATGMDALTHAVEAYIGLSGTKSTNDYAEKATKLIFENLETAYNDGKNLQARENMLVASFYAGMAFTRAYVGYVHAIAHNLGGIYGTPHGLANAVILPHVLEYYGDTAYEKLAKLAEIVGIGGYSQADKAMNFIDAIKEMNRNMDIPEHFDFIKDEDIPTIVERALKEGNPLYPVPKIMDAKDCEKVIKAVRGF